MSDLNPYSSPKVVHEESPASVRKIGLWRHVFGTVLLFFAILLFAPCVFVQIDAQWLHPHGYVHDPLTELMIMPAISGAFAIMAMFALLERKRALVATIIVALIILASVLCGRVVIHHLRARERLLLPTNVGPLVPHP